MLYHAYELQRSWLSHASSMAAIGAEMLTNPINPLGYTGLGPMAASALEVFAHATASYGKPAFGIEEIKTKDGTFPVIESTVVNKPFGDLKRFRLDGVDTDGGTGRPKLLIAAPMSGHYATLLRGTVERICLLYTSPSPRDS